MIVFCTCFDKGYLDKGLVLYHSLKRNCNSFKIYIFCFDEISFNILNEMEMGSAEICYWKNYETTELLILKKERTKAEYYWTCTPQIIKTVLEHYNEEHCIYIDADLAFFSDPTVLLDEINQAGCHIGIMEHRFNEGFSGRRYLRRSGKYCVEFNYFDQEAESQKALSWWAEKCMEWCYHIREPERMGDQKYLMKFEQLFKGVYVFKHLGAGVAPWNSKQYNIKYASQDVELEWRGKGNKPKDVKMVFYHYQNMNFISDAIVNVSSGTSNREFVKTIYYPYIYAILRCRKELNKKGIGFDEAKEYSSNAIVRLWQHYLLKYKIRTLADIVFIKEVVKEIESDTYRDILS